MLSASLCSGLIMLAGFVICVSKTQWVRMADFDVSKETSWRSMTTTCHVT